MSNLHNDPGSVRDDAAATQGVVTCPSCRTRWRVAQEVATNLRCRCSRCDEVFSPGDAKTAYRVRLAPAGSDAGIREVTSVGNVPLEAHGAAPVGDLRVGMDDPSLADRLGRTALHGGSDRKAWTWTVVADPDSNEQHASGASDADADSTPSVLAVGCEAAVFVAEDPETAVASPGEIEAPPEREDEAAAEPGDVPDGPASLRESPLEPLIEALDGAHETEAAVEPAVAPTFDEVEAIVHHDVAGTQPHPVSDRARARRSGAGSLLIVALLGTAGAMAAWTWTPWLTAVVIHLLARWSVTAGVGVPTDPSFWAGPGAVCGLLLGWGWLRWTLRSD